MHTTPRFQILVTVTPAPTHTEKNNVLFTKSEITKFQKMTDKPKF